MLAENPLRTNFQQRYEEIVAMQRIFDKTCTGRQADLVKLVAGHMSPLA